MSLFYVDLKTNSSERFDLAKFLENKGDNFDVLTSDFIIEMKKLPYASEYAVKGEDSRPDLLSYNIYGNIQYWWILIIYNDKLSFDDIKTGDIIKCPSASDIDALFFSLRTKQTAAQGV